MAARKRAPTPVGERVRALREAAGVTQVDLAARVGLAPWSLCNMEKGRRRALADEIERIATALGVSIADFYAGSGAR